MKLRSTSLVLWLVVSTSLATAAPADPPADRAPAPPSPGPADAIREILALQGKGTDAIPKLRKFLEDPREQVRSAAVQILAKEGGASAVADLAVMVSDKDDDVATSAVAGLLEISGPSTAEPIRKAFASESSRVRQNVALYVGESRDRRFVAELGKLVSDGIPDVRKSAVGSLQAIGGPEVIPFLLAATGDSANDVATSAIDALGILGDPRATDRLVRLVSSDREPVRTAVAQALARIADPALHPEAFGKLLEDPSKEVRLALLAGFRDHPTAGSIPLVATALKVKEPKIRRMAIVALKANPDVRADEALTTLLADPSEDVRAGAILALTERKAAPRFGPIAGLIGDKSARVRGAVASAAGRIGGSDGAAILKTLVSDTDASVRALAAESAGVMGGTAGLAIAEVAIRDKDALVRLQTVQALGAIGSAEALGRLRKTLGTEKDLNVRIAIIGELGRCRDVKAVPLLKPLLKADAERVRNAARVALDRIAAPGGSADTTPPKSAAPAKP